MNKPTIALCTLLLAFASGTPAREAREVVDSACAKCHATGKHGAPRIGDRTAWTPRMARGIDALTWSAIVGHGPMPSRGDQSQLTDPEIRAAILYMFNHGLPVLPPPTEPVKPDPFHKVAKGTEIWFGMMRAQTMRDMGVKRTDIPRGKGYYHLNIALADLLSNASVRDAQVTIDVSDGMTVESKPLRAVFANSRVTYGEFFRFTSGSSYNITARIQRPGVPDPIEARFAYRAP
ncbi:MAG: cytochrome c5 family protein [Burkholderiales bacterium]|nr:cytochrome c5 family protein [Burkholderiales bacterium]